jgi:hypothetical protein
MLGKKTGGENGIRFWPYTIENISLFSSLVTQFVTRLPKLKGGPKPELKLGDRRLQSVSVLKSCSD